MKRMVVMRGYLKFVLFAVVFCTLGLTVGSASAEDTPLLLKDQGMAPSLFRPAVDTKGHFTIDSTPVLPHLAISLGMVLDFGFHEWLAVEQNGLAPYNRTTVDKYIATRLLFDVGLFDRLVIGAQVPIIIPAGDMYDINATGDPAKRGWSSKGAFGDIAFHAKMHITRANLHLIGIGAVIQYEAPSGKPELLGGDPGGAFSGKLIFDIEPARRYRMAINIGARYPIKAEEDNYLRNANVPTTLLFKYGPTLNFGLGQSFVMWPGLMDFVLEFYGNQLASEFGSAGYTSLEANAGFKFYMQESSYLMVGYAHGIPVGDTDSGYGYQSMEHRMFLGFAFEPSIPDRDGDGIGDADDQCPNEPEDRDGFEDSDGCPDLDNDRDGIPDVEDACPLVPEDMDEDRDEDGCPEDPADPTDDRDGDRIPDLVDKCPDDPETYNGLDDEDGCPDKGDVELTSSVIKTLKKIYFEYNSDVIKKVSFKILNKVVAAIKANPQIELFEVQGHADERGPERYNLTLTRKRAAAVKRYLVKKGLSKKMIRSVGYGEYCPLKQGHSEEAWEENRRVEFIVLKIGGHPTGVDPSCKRAKRKGIVSKPVKATPKKKTPKKKTPKKKAKKK
jgi:OOP family OmpA-OmpF porin